MAVAKTKYFAWMLKHGVKNPIELETEDREEALEFAFERSLELDNFSWMYVTFSPSVPTGTGKLRDIEARFSGGCFVPFSGRVWDWMEKAHPEYIWNDAWYYPESS